MPTSYKQTVKYPKTYHLPFSIPSKNDKRLKSAAHFVGKEVVLTSKLDGSNTTMSKDHCFARSHNGAPTHPSFDLFKQIHNNIKHIIPNDINIYLEYCYALHSLPYTQLPSYLLAFNVLDTQTMTWASWNEVERICQSLGIAAVPLLWRGVIESERALRTLVEHAAREREFGCDPREGVVVRLAGSFPNSEFANSIAKYVNKSFADIDKEEHWKHKQIVKNGLKSEYIRK